MSIIKENRLQCKYSYQKVFNGNDRIEGMLMFTVSKKVTERHNLINELIFTGLVFIMER